MNRIKCFFVLITISLWSVVCVCQEYPHYPPPLDIPLVLSGTFGEPRSTHFHAGLDIKTQGKEGLKVHAVSSGSIKKIGISHWSYGKVLYLYHDDGYMSVYAHLMKFSPKIEAYIKKIQYKRQTYQLSIDVPKEVLSIKEGEVIGFSGNTGSSGGPHLHFEIRKKGTQNPTNPMLFGIHIKDNILPHISELYIYPQGKSSQVEGSNTPVKINISKQKDNSYLADRIKASGIIGVGINTYDQLNYSINKNGPYRIQLKLNGSEILSYQFDTFPSKESKYVKTILDYEKLIKERKYIQKCFITPENKFNIYNIANNKGLINVKEKRSYQVNISVADFQGNVSMLVLPIEGEKIPIINKNIDPMNTPYRIGEERHNISTSRDSYIKFKNTSVYFPKEVFFKNETISFIENQESFSVLHTPHIPLNRNYTITFDIPQRLIKDKHHLYVALMGKRPRYVSTKIVDNNKLKARTRLLGKFQILKDNTPPNITYVNLKANQWVSRYKYLKFKISDSQTGIRSYKGWINDKWILFEYEPKKSMITFNFDDMKLKQTKNILKIEVRDNAGNTQKLETVFYRKSK